MIYNFGAMQEKANELRAVLPGLIENGEWNEIRAIARISPMIWEGHKADSYDQDVLQACGLQDARLAMELPNTIERAIQQMYEADQMEAERIRNMFEIFY